MQLYCKDGRVLAWHDDTQAVPPSAYGDGVAIMPWSEPIEALDRVGERPDWWTEGQPDTREYAAPASPPARTVWPPRELMQTLFTAGERTALFTARRTEVQIDEFITFLTATPMVDITHPEFVADINATKTAGLLTEDRVAQVLAGTPAPTGA